MPSSNPEYDSVLAAMGVAAQALLCAARGTARSFCYRVSGPSLPPGLRTLERSKLVVYDPKRNIIRLTDGGYRLAHYAKNRTR